MKKLKKPLPKSRPSRKELRETPVLVPGVGPRKYKPNRYQSVAIKAGLQHACMGLIMNPGLGKTSVAMAIYLLLKQRRMTGPWLVVTPLKPMYRTWRQEGAKWKEFNGLKMVILHGKDKEANLKQKADLYLINPDGLPWLFAQFTKRTWPWTALVVDESSKFKRTRTQRFKNLKTYLPWFARRYIMTGSFMPNGYMDLFGQMFILDEGHALGRYITHYRNTYFYQTGYGGYTYVLQPKAATKIEKKIKPLVVHFSEDDHLKMPKLVERDHIVDMPPEAKKLYKEMDNDFVIKMGRAEVTAPNTAAAYGKCRQISNGGIYVGEGKKSNGVRPWKPVHDAKTEGVLELLDELNGQNAIIAYEFDHDRERLIKALGKGTMAIRGGMNEKDLDRVCNAWDAGKLPHLLIQWQSGHGMNLQFGGSVVICYGLTYNFEDYDQIIRRIYRQGQTKTVYVYHVACRGTRDMAMINTLASKDNRQRGFLQRLKTPLHKLDEEWERNWAAK